MVPTAYSARAGAVAAPRARGDGPPSGPFTLPPGHCSPRPRGWSRIEWCRVTSGPLLPAPAGMVPRSGSTSGVGVPAPRARGDGPSTRSPSRSMRNCSPRPRGWSRHQDRRPHRRDLLPAPAGMVPQTLRVSGDQRTAPRARGDGPNECVEVAVACACSPRPRGWSRRVGDRVDRLTLLPAPAGMVPARPPGAREESTAPRARGDGPTTERKAMFRRPCSPRPRGWSRGNRERLARHPLLPAPAGMVPSGTAWRRTRPTAPRARGDGPATAAGTGWWCGCSPRPRGWSPVRAPAPDVAPLLPAPAGMVPRESHRSADARTAPRARGDGPGDARVGILSGRCSPRPQGWSPQVGFGGPVEELLPAPAGMVPPPKDKRHEHHPAPRARGDGPDTKISTAPQTNCSPRPRGWSPVTDG